MTNYEVDKTVRVTRNATGNIKRLNAAVVLNHRTTTDAKGKTNTQPISDEELEKLTALVRETIGMDDKRGDSIKLISAPFQPVKEEVDDTPIWKRPEAVDMVKTLALPAAMTLAALIVVFGAIRPAIQAAKPPPPPEPEADAAGCESDVTRLDAVVDDDEALPGEEGGEQLALPAPGPDERLVRAAQLAKDNPLAVANVLRGWMNG